ncbi:hypothetical protein COB11_05145 [Candidatus Aerophobetes bacterium]|uniref:Outer membrane protein beta-barrel domain-containing protein n=1 Tax=Aerophobetes bacterium TaxID=2030807 RepID=A0A2A4YGD7_UNCAE|nr:MAG: hypothetical protein COB11_05145 [Candidatus Aerophobetes bacterium]
MKFQRILLVFSGLMATVFGTCSDVDSKEPSTDYDIAPSSNCYFTIGTSVYYQNVGIGYRTRNLSTNKGNDFSINAKYFPVKKVDGHGIHLYKHSHRVYPSLQYLRLSYQDPRGESSSKKYFGAGLEIVGLIDDGYIYPTPNPKIAWGVENSHGQFSQFAINIVPAFVDVFFIANAKKEQSWKNKIGLTALSMTFEYSLGF